MKRFPTTVAITLLLIALDALMWFTFGAIVAAGGIASLAEPPALRWAMAILAWAAAGALTVLAFLLSRRKRIAYAGAVALLLIIVILSITDQVGWADVVALTFSVIPLVLLLKDRGWYFRPGPTGVHANHG